mgnify:FL=1
MDILNWARKEVEIACKKERGNAPDGEWDYGCGCYESALKAFESLCKDGHSGMSIQFTKHILNRLINGEPLTPIEDTDDVWNCRGFKHNNYTSYQCKRMSSLFKDVYDDGTVKYSDIDRVITIDMDNDSSWTNSFCTKIVDEMFPITMPYVGGEQYKLYRQDFLFDKNNGDYDTIKISHVITPNGEKIDINRYFKEGTDGFVEIDEDEYYGRFERRFFK